MSKQLTHAEVEERLWKTIDSGQHTGMLGLAGGGRFQPMTAFVERETNQIWFFTRADTEIAEAAARGAEAAFIVQSHNLWASIDGRISVRQDRERMDRYWNAHVAAWYPDGKGDPNLTLMCLDCEDASVWLAEGGPIKYAWEVAKANASKSTPDVGERRDLNLH
jgi:general stress protein 26